MISTELQSAMRWGSPLQTAKAAMILLHGRGGSAQDMRALTRLFESPGFAFIAPEAPDHTWYPFPFTAPLAQNEPYLSRALDRVRRLLSELAEEQLPSSHVLLLGFSQGACLALEFAARNFDCCSGVIGLSGGLIGPPGPTRDPGDRKTRMSVFLGCGDQDPHIAVERVEETARYFESAGAAVEKRIYPGMGHVINSDEVEQVKRLMAGLTSGG